MDKEETFEGVFFHFEQENSKKLREYLKNFFSKRDLPRMQSLSYVMIEEIIINALKAIYKDLYYKYFIEELGFPNITYQEWLELFKTELEEHRIDNFSRLAKEKNLGAKIRITPYEDKLHVVVENPGVPSEIEWERIRASIEKAKETDDLALYLEEEDEEDPLKEGAGLGLILIGVMLKRLGASIEENFKIYTKDSTTVTELIIPLPQDKNKEQEKESLRSS